MSLKQEIIDLFYDVSQKMEDNLKKTAAKIIRELDSENSNLRAQLSLKEEAIKLAFDLLDSGFISAEDLKEKINIFSNSTEEELEVIKKASEFTKTASYKSIFKLSSEKSYNEFSTAEERFISSLMND